MWSKWKWMITLCSSQWHLHGPVVCILFQSLPAFAPFLSFPVACCLCLSLPDFVALPSCFMFLAVLCCFFLFPSCLFLFPSCLFKVLLCCLSCPFQCLTNFRQLWRHSLRIPVPSCCPCWCFAQSTVFSRVFLCPFPFLFFLPLPVLCFCPFLFFFSVFVFPSSSTLQVGSRGTAAARRCSTRTYVQHRATHIHVTTPLSHTHAPTCTHALRHTKVPKDNEHTHTWEQTNMHSSIHEEDDRKIVEKHFIWDSFLKKWFKKSLFEISPGVFEKSISRRTSCFVDQKEKEYSLRRSICLWITCLELIFDKQTNKNSLEKNNVAKNVSQYEYDKTVRNRSVRRPFEKNIAETILFTRRSLKTII